MRDYKDYLIRKVMEHNNITVHLGVGVTPEELNADGFCQKAASVQQAVRSAYTAALAL